MALRRSSSWLPSTTSISIALDRGSCASYRRAFVLAGDKKDGLKKEDWGCRQDVQEITPPELFKPDVENRGYVSLSTSHF